MSEDEEKEAKEAEEGKEDQIEEGFATKEEYRSELWPVKDRESEREN
jgi:hypothetical protein